MFHASAIVRFINIIIKYIAGGYSHCAGQRWGESKSTTSIEMLSIHQSLWIAESSMKYARSSHCSAVIHGKVYVFGGENESMIMDSVEMYDPGIYAWRELDPMPTPRYCTCFDLEMVLP